MHFGGSNCPYSLNLNPSIDKIGGQSVKVSLNMTYKIGPPSY